MKVLKFGAVWCSGCLVMRPRWAEIEKEHPWLKTKNLDFDQAKKEVDQYDIQGGKLPVFVFLDKKGKEFLRLQGEPSKAKLIEIIKANKNR